MSERALLESVSWPEVFVSSLETMNDWMKGPFSLFVTRRQVAKSILYYIYSYIYMYRCAAKKSGLYGLYR